MEGEGAKIEVRDLRQGDWLWTHKKVLFSPHISASDFKVYSGLASHAGNADQRSWPSLQTLATELHLSRSTVIRSMRVLVSCKLVGVERREGMSNVYILLPSKEVPAPLPVKKENSPHHRLIAFFYETTQKTRGVKPVWGTKDLGRLKQVLEMAVMDDEQIERLMLYFLASPKFKKYSPSLATFFSSGIFNGLMNSMRNDSSFWKDLDRFSEQFLPRAKPVAIPMVSMTEMVQRLTGKMTITKPREPAYGR